MGSDIDLLRLYSNFTFVKTPAARHRVVVRAELGAVFLAAEDRINLAPSLSFFAGGSQSIRGYGYQSLGNEVQLVQRDDSQASLTVGGDRLLTASMEYQYYVNDTWRGAVFVDAGDAFDEGEFEVNVGVGFGVRDAESAAQVAGVADAVIVGSVLVKQLAELVDQPDKIPATLAATVAELRAAIDQGI